MITRRRFIRYLKGAALTAAAFKPQTLWSSGPSLEPLSNSAAINAWLSIATASANEDRQTRSLTKPLIFSRFVEPIYFLVEPIEWDPNQGSEVYQSVVVPKGFVTDLASIPRIFYSLLRPDGEYTYPAIVHDYLYWIQRGTRAEADRIFRLGMEDLSIDKLTIDTIYGAVRSGGQPSWDNNRKLRQNGERRVLARFPTTPTTHWSDWKKSRDNFGVE